MKYKGFAVFIIILVLLLFTGEVANARGAKFSPARPAAVQASIESAPFNTVAPGAIPIQGRLTNASGKPLSGTYPMVFSLYETEAAITSLCIDIRDVTVTNGLFNDVMDHCYDNIHGQKVWLGIQVGSDPEMTPRQPIYPVPYAVSLMPSAAINYPMDGHAMLNLENSAPTGKGLSSIASSATGINYGVVGQSASPSGFGGSFSNTGGGVGLSSSSSGVAISAQGSGIIQSASQSSIWISGNGARPASTTDTTVIALDNVGGAKIYPGTTVSNKNVMLPITIPGPLYGQNVKVVGMDIYYQTATEFDVITVVLMRRQTGTCTVNSPSCFLNILNDPADRVCDVANHAAGCIQHYDLSSNNTLTSTSGILYLTLELSFSGAGTWVDIGGIRLLLEHD